MADQAEIGRQVAAMLLWATGSIANTSQAVRGLNHFAEYDGVGADRIAPMWRKLGLRVENAFDSLQMLLWRASSAFSVQVAPAATADLEKAFLRSYEFVDHLLKVRIEGPPPPAEVLVDLALCEAAIECLIVHMHYLGAEEAVFTYLEPTGDGAGSVLPIEIRGVFHGPPERRRSFMPDGKVSPSLDAAGLEGAKLLFGVQKIVVQPLGSRDCGDGFVLEVPLAPRTAT